MQLNQREGDKNHPGASGGNLISRGGGGRNDVQSIAIFKNTPAAKRSCGRGGEKSERGEERGTKRKRCLQNQTDDIGGGGGLVSNSPPSFVRPDYRNEFETSLKLDTSRFFFLSSPIFFVQISRHSASVFD